MKPRLAETLLRLTPLAAAVLWCAVSIRWLDATPLCGYHWITGHPCPLCGMTRALAALAAGRWMEAVALNALSPLAAALLIAAPLLALAPEFERHAWKAAVSAFGVFGVLRLF